MTEFDIQKRMFIYLQRYFKPKIEVWSTDRKKRIDIAMIHKSDIEKKFPIGIEIKINEKKSGKDLSLWLKQAIEYTQKEFIGYGKLMVITYPQISGLYLNEGLSMHIHIVTDPDDFACQNNVNTFLGQSKIGEFQKYRRDNKEFCRIVFKGALIWDEFKDQFRINNYIARCKN